MVTQKFLLYFEGTGKQYLVEVGQVTEHWITGLSNFCLNNNWITPLNLLYGQCSKMSHENIRVSHKNAFSNCLDDLDSVYNKQVPVIFM